MGKTDIYSPREPKMQLKLGICCMFFTYTCIVIIYTHEFTVAGKKKKKMGSYSPEIPCAVFQTVSTVLKQEKLRCNFCNIMFSTETELSHHNSDPRHRVNVRRNTQQANAKFAKVTNFRPPPDGVYMGRYKLCRRLDIVDFYIFNVCAFNYEEW